MSLFGHGLSNGLRMLSVSKALAWVVGLAVLTPGLFAQQPSGASNTNPLVKGKIFSVEPMPESLERWILDDLRVWGRYKVTTESEGASLVMEAQVPETSTEIDVRGGIPQPRRKAPRVGRPPT